MLRLGTAVSKYWRSSSCGEETEKMPVKDDIQRHIDVLIDGSQDIYVSGRSDSLEWLSSSEVSWPKYTYLFTHRQTILGLDAMW
jgi:hypothetical protein